jgi:DNA sulfur modification protein DndD
VIIKSISLENFRQFLGKQEIEFATGMQNITIIFGDNGKGKTGIFRAMMFGLFGEKTIAQDKTDKSKTDDLHLVNLNAIDDNQGRPTEGIVEIRFENKSFDYKVVRKISAYRHNGEIIERETDVKLEIFDSTTGLTRNVSRDLVESEINKVLEKNIREFFFFDAEKIDTLSSTQNKVKEVVKQGIVKILQLDLIENGSKLLGRTITKYKQSLVEKSNNRELSTKIDNQRSYEFVKEQSEQEVIELESNIVELNRELSEIQEKLESNAEIHQINERIRERETLVNEKLGALDLIFKSIASDHFRKFHQLFLEDEFKRASDIVSLTLKDHNSFIPRQLLELTLDHEECFLCKSDLSNKSDIKDEIRRMIREYSPSETVSTLLLMSNSISEFEMNSKNQKESLIQISKTIEDVQEERNQIENQISKLKEEADSIAARELDFDQLEKSKKKILDDKQKYHKDLVLQNIKIENSEKTIRELEIEIRKLQSKEKGLAIDAKKIDILVSLKKDLDEISNEYCDTMRKHLMDETTKIFKLIIDEKDRNIVNKIMINEKYEIEVFGWNNAKMTQDISQGQRQMVSLAFISALAKLATGDNQKIDFPLFMDTPFGRVSGKNRDNLIVNMPNFTSQWILLFTDTELTSTEERVFKQGGKLGRTYKLDQIAEGNTRIIEVDISQPLASRG